MRFKKGDYIIGENNKSIYTQAYVDKVENGFYWVTWYNCSGESGVYNKVYIEKCHVLDISKIRNELLLKILE